MKRKFDFTQQDVSTIESSPIPFVMLECASAGGPRVYAVSDGFCDMIGKAREKIREMFASRKFEFVDIEDRAKIEGAIRDYMEKGKKYDAVFRERNGKRKQRTIHARGETVKCADGKELLVIRYEDVSDIVKVTKGQKTFEEIAHSFYGEDRKPTVVVSRSDATVLYYNKAFCDLIPPVEGHEDGASFWRYFYGKDATEAFDFASMIGKGTQLLYERRSGRWLSATVKELDWGGKPAFMMRLSVKDNKFFDTTTQLPNLNFLLAAAPQYVAERKREGKKTVCIYFTFNGLHSFNALTSRDENTLMRSFADVIGEAYPDSIVAKVDFESFVVFTEDENTEEKLAGALDLLRMRRTRKYIGVRAGVYRPSDLEDVYSMCEKARTACQLVSRHDRDFDVYDDRIDDTIRLNEFIKNNFESAIEKGNIYVYYQPVVRMLTKTVCGMEALSRWEDPEFGLLLPDDFIAPLERCGMLSKLDEYVIDSVCRMQAKQAETGRPTVPVSVNLSGSDFFAFDVCEYALRKTAEYGVPHSMISFEIPENVFLYDSEHVSATISALRNAGFGIIMDDFGSGYSSISVLSGVSFTDVKLDRNTLARLSERTERVLNSSIDMISRIGAQSICEGVENAEQAALLKSVGCQKAQGFYFGRPHVWDKTIRRCLAKGYVIEDDKMRAYYDAVGKVNLVTDKPIVIFEDDGSYFKVLYANRTFLEEAASLGVTGEAEAESRINDPGSSLAHKVRVFVSAEMKEGEQHSIIYAYRNRFLQFGITFLAGMGGRKLYVVELSRVTKSQTAKESVDAALNSLYLCCNEIYVLNVPKDEVRSLVSTSHFIPVGNRVVGIGKHTDKFCAEYVHPLDRERFAALNDVETFRRDIARSGNGFVVNYFRIRSETGDYNWMAQTAQFVPGSNGAELILYFKDAGINENDLFGLLAGLSSHDVGELDVIAYFEGVFGNVPETVCISRLDTHKIVYLNPYGRKEYGVQPSRDLSDMTCFELFHKGERSCGFCKDVTEVKSSKFGFFSEKKRKYYSVKDSLIEIGGTKYKFEMIIDVGEEQKLISELAETDMLTGLLNRRGGERGIQSFISAHPDSPAMLIELDINDFKRFNDVYGHDVGDKVLIALATEVREHFGKNAIAMRTGGDEFVIFMPYDDLAAAQKSIARFAMQTHECKASGNSYAFGVSMGYCAFPAQADTLTSLMEKADKAMYSVKINGEGSSYQQYDDSISNASRTQLSFNFRDVTSGLPGAVLICGTSGDGEVFFASRETVGLLDCSTYDEFVDYVSGCFKGIVHPADVDDAVNALAQKLTEEGASAVIKYRIRTKKGAVKRVVQRSKLVLSKYFGELIYSFIYEE